MSCYFWLCVHITAVSPSLPHWSHSPHSPSNYLQHSYLSRSNLSLGFLMSLFITILSSNVFLLWNSNAAREPPGHFLACLYCFHSRLSPLPHKIRGSRHVVSTPCFPNSTVSDLCTVVLVLAFLPQHRNIPMCFSHFKTNKILHPPHTIALFPFPFTLLFGSPPSSSIETVPAKINQWPE